MQMVVYGGQCWSECNFVEECENLWSVVECFENVVEGRTI